ncbi:ATP-dependent DNA helicase DinG [Paenibacillus sp. GP183]|uniref:ATP-dependent DNA helicase DinG n=1 Tax=Paenibacillus sp. GP183 TaxID=1882751 RepID=UPI000899D588|nr:ATP-dependent DNA helicase DinG [Paenibacillus sp. GP183]SEB63340.1 ATP-dependent DNA helicase DinG [Paenibacillus sp. GP183]
MKFAVLDFETTGSQAADEIIQVGLVIIDGFEIVHRYTSLVNPGICIPSLITTLTGITDEMVEHAPVLDQVMTEMFPLLFDCVLVGHHIPFDLGFLQKGLISSGFPAFEGRVLDTIDALRILFPSLTSFQLGMVAGTFGLHHDRPHQADSDAEVTAELWIICMQRLVGLPLLSVQRLSQIFEPDASDLGWFMDEIRAFKEAETAVDMDTHRYFRQFTVNVGDWGEEESEREEETLKALETPFPDFYKDIKKSLQDKFEVYEDRVSQEQMVQEVEDSLESEQHLMIEAGTGTGKSLGYLIPSLYYGLKHDKKVIVSTHTINLQEQLRERDIPLLSEIFPVPFQAAVLKGRSHYLCLRKFENKLSMRDYENGKEDPITAGQMVVWLGETKNGDEEEIHFGNKGRQFWHTVASDTDSCLNRQCPWFKKCFYHRARNDANAADLVITNHSMLFTDMKAEGRLLPQYKNLIIDEAHHFEEVASKHLGIELHSSAFLHTLQWLYKDNRSGQLPMLRFRLQKFEEEERAAGWCQVIDTLYPKVVLIKEEWDRLSESLYELVSSKSDASQSESGQFVLRVREDHLPQMWPELLIMEESIFLNASEIVRILEKLVNEIKDVQDKYEVQSLITDLGGILKELYGHRDALHFFMKMTDKAYVYWMEAGAYSKSKSLQLISVPTDVSSLLQQHFFDTKDSIVMTSATLSVNRSFQYSADQLGLQIPENEEKGGKVRTVQLPSPFNYREQALVCIPRDFPGIKGSMGDQVFIKALIDSLSEVALATHGRMLVLFTSSRMLKQIYSGLKERLQPHSISVLGQGVDSGNRSKLTRLFQDNHSCVLLGTSSFWEGVDIPGDALSCLAIVRLPFQPPNHPLVEAKSENIKKRNENPFMKFSVPQAVIRFKQGFGRLVRRASDKGVVIIYDTRVIDTQYGKYFLYSLPGPKIEHMNTEQMVPRIQEWMGEKSHENNKNIRSGSSKAADLPAVSE